MVACFAVTAIAFASYPHGDTTVKRSCFPAKLWGGGTVPDDMRPCIVIGRPQEDGSDWLTYEEAGTTYQVACDLPNPHEGGQSFLVKCRKVNAR
jgi:hypothetical protein